MNWIKCLGYFCYVLVSFKICFEYFYEEKVNMWMFEGIFKKIGKFDKFLCRVEYKIVGF